MSGQNFSHHFQNFSFFSLLPSMPLKPSLSPIETDCAFVSFLSSPLRVIHYFPLSPSFSSIHVLPSPPKHLKTRHSDLPYCFILERIPSQAHQFQSWPGTMYQIGGNTPFPGKPREEKRESPVQWRGWVGILATPSSLKINSVYGWKDFFRKHNIGKSWVLSEVHAA